MSKNLKAIMKNHIYMRAKIKDKEAACWLLHAEPEIWGSMVRYAVQAAVTHKRLSRA